MIYDLGETSPEEAVESNQAVSDKPNIEAAIAAGKIKKLEKDSDVLSDASSYIFNFGHSKDLLNIPEVEAQLKKELTNSEEGKITPYVLENGGVLELMLKLSADYVAQFLSSEDGTKQESLMELILSELETRATLQTYINMVRHGLSGNLDMIKTLVSQVEENKVQEKLKGAVDFIDTLLSKLEENGGTVPHEAKMRSQLVKSKVQLYEWRQLRGTAESAMRIQNT